MSSDLSHEGFGELGHGFSTDRLHAPPPKDELIAEDDSAQGVSALASHLTEKWRAEGKTDSSESPIIDRRYINHATGDDIPQDKIVTVKEVGRDLGHVHKVEAEAAQQNADAELAQKVDDARTQWHYENNPEFRAQADALIQQNQQQHQNAPVEQPQPEPQQSADPNDELVRAWQSTDPKVRAALEAQVTEIQKAHQSYLASTAQQASLISAALFQDFAELRGLHTPQELQTVVDATARVNPERAQLMAARAHQAATLLQVAQQAQAHEQQRQAHLQSQQFKQFIDSEDKKFLDKHPEYADATSRMPIAEAAMRTLEAAGVSKEELRRSYFNGEGISLRSAAAQEIILKAALYDQAKQGAIQPAKPSVPPVQRPGTHRGFSNTGDENIAALERRVAKDGSLKNVAALRYAKLKARGG